MNPIETAAKAIAQESAGINYNNLNHAGKKRYLRIAAAALDSINLYQESGRHPMFITRQPIEYHNNIILNGDPIPIRDLHFIDRTRHVTPWEPT
jgi:hypothetical protein